jgi:WD40 repeat protein
MTSQVTDPTRKTKAFISYSRKNLAFVDELLGRLDKLDIQSFVDRADIDAFEDWWERIQALIRQSDVFIYVISPDSVASPICLRELDYAVSLSKRLAPIVAERIPEAATPAPIRRLNWVYFDDITTVDTSARKLVEALTSDINWVRQHTALLEKAYRWANTGKPGPVGLLLHSPELEEAERWISIRPPGAPSPLKLHAEYIIESRNEEQRRSRMQRRRSRAIATGSLIAAGLVSALGWLFFTASQEAQRSQSQFLADVSRQRLDDGDPVSAMLLALEGLKDNHSGDFKQRFRPLEPAAAIALDAALRNWSSRPWNEAVVLLGHGGAVTRVAYSADGRLISTGSDDQTAAIWDAKTGRMLRRLRGHTKGITSVAFSPNGRLLATSSWDATVRVWDTEGGGKATLLAGHRLGVRNVVFTSDGKHLISTSDDRTVRVWSVNPPQLLTTMSGHDDLVWSAAQSADGKTVASVSQDKTARLWDLESGNEIHVLRHAGDVRGLSFSPDGKILATAGADGTVRTWDVALGTETRTLKGHTGFVFDVKFSVDGKRLWTAGDDKTVRSWNVQTGQAVAILKHPENARRVFLSADGVSVCTLTLGGTARLWDASSGGLLYELRGHSDWIRHATFSPDGRSLATASVDATVRIWNAAPIEEPRVIGSYLIFTIALNVQLRRAFSRSLDGTSRLWNLDTGEVLATYPTVSESVAVARPTPDWSRVAVVTKDQVIRYLDLATGEETSRLVLDFPAPAMNVDFSPDGRLVTLQTYITTPTGLVEVRRFYDSLTGRPQQQVNALMKSGRGWAFLPKEPMVAIATDDGDIGLWRYDANERIELIPIQCNGAPRFLNFSPNGRWLFSVCPDGSIVILDFARRKPAGRWTGHEGNYLMVSISPDSRWAFVNSNSKFRVWNTEDAREQFISLDPAFYVGAVDFSPDSRLVAGISAREGASYAHVWQLSTGREIARLDGRSPLFLSNREVVTLLDEKMKISQIEEDIQRLVDTAKEKTPRCLSNAERVRFHIEGANPNWCRDRWEVPVGRR